MPGTKETFDIPRDGQSPKVMVDFNQDFDAAGSSDYVRFQESEAEVVFHLSGTATSFVAVVERATRDPVRDTANWAPAEDEQWTGNLATGVAPRIYHEPLRGYWRLRIISMSGGNLRLNIMGEQA